MSLSSSSRIEALELSGALPDSLSIPSVYSEPLGYCVLLSKDSKLLKRPRHAFPFALADDVVNSDHQTDFWK